jgi:hypothetical protein
MSKNIKKIVGQPLLTISYKKPLGKFFALSFAIISYKKPVGNLFALSFANGYL